VRVVPVPLVGGVGSWSQCMRKNERGLSMNRTNFECALPSKAAEDRRTPRRWSVGHSRWNFRQVLESAPACGALDFPGRFKVPMHAQQRKKPFYEPWMVWSSAFRRLERLGPAKAGTPIGQRLHGPSARLQIRVSSTRFRERAIIWDMESLHPWKSSQPLLSPNSTSDSPDRFDRQPGRQV